MGPMSFGFSFSLAWDVDEGDMEASGQGGADFLATLNPNVYVSLLKHIHIPQTHLQKVKADVQEIVKHIAPFRIAISTDIQQSRSRSVIFLKVVDTTTLRSPTSQSPTLGNLRSDVLKIFNEPGKLWSDDEKQAYHPHLTLRRYCKPHNIKHEAHTCSDVIRHVGPFRTKLGLIIRGITLFRDTSLGPRVVQHFPFGGYYSSFSLKAIRTRDQSLR
ncbi:hypothetical protein MVEN_02408300 [Mycena venus]|uniref:Uncharacterized protein n=1 Tax=Mycena venus TaxID=2733690 RepID=A0A8H6X2L8_9AGAR|nr:hypothetical protein MVEN_02408300 [Mycena venus]